MKPSHQLAHEIRRVIERLQVTDIADDDLVALADQMRAVADRLDEQPRRDSWHVDRTISLAEVFDPASAAGGWGEHGERSPVGGRSNPTAPPLSVQLVDGDDGRYAHGEVTLTATHEGAPGTAHGGIVAALCDEMLGLAQPLAGVAGYTGTLTVRFRAPTPTYVPLILRAWVDRIDGRKIFMAGTICAEETLCAQAEGIYISPA
jgi:acyl-coenzyme A thioesterase PaaI-like protein